jgi:hypothetical protein
MVIEIIFIVLVCVCIALLAYKKNEHYTKLQQVSLKYGPKSDYFKTRIRKDVGQMGD